MSALRNLHDVYINELRNLWSANNHLRDAAIELGAAVTSSELKTLLDVSITNVGKHKKVLILLIGSDGGKTSKGHSKGMKGLCKDAEKQALSDDLQDDEIRDVVIFSHHQRLSKYVTDGLSSAAILAEILKLPNDAAMLLDAVDDFPVPADSAAQLAALAAKLLAKQC